MKTIYTAGYTGKKVTWLKQKAEELDAIVLDVRYSPRSRNPFWQRDYLEKVLGERYSHVKALGNSNYRGVKIKISDLETGIKIIDYIDQPIILLCVCADPNVCHRTVIAEELKNRGYEVIELTPSPPEQGELWS